MKSKSYIKPSKDQLENLAKIRYEKMSGKLPFTINCLEKNPTFKETFLKMKKKNYPDWVIYMAILNISMSHRIRILQKKGLSDPQILNQATQLIGNEVELESEALGIDDVSEKELEFAIDLFVMSFLRAEGFESRRRTPNIKALRQFAEKELDFFKYDYPHKKWFSFEKNLE